MSQGRTKGRTDFRKIKFLSLKEDDDCFARIAWKNHKHSVNNPYSQFRDEYTLVRFYYKNNEKE